MEITNPKYQKQGIHLITSIFTVDKGIVKVLLIKRKNNPYKDYWSLVGGALYNDEELASGLKREIKLKTGLEDIDLRLCSVYDEIKTTKDFRMVAISYIGLINHNKVKIKKDTIKTSNADWFDIDCVPNLAYEHNNILNEAIKYLKKELLNTNILKSLYPDGFTIPELQKITESILNKELDRRNFRKKILSFDFIYETGKYRTVRGNKPAKVYDFKENYNYDKSVF